MVYYSGHGALALNPTGRPNQPKQWRCLVPTDWETGRGFRGILDAELSALMAKLTARTKNVAVILDCCHAAQMSRAADPSALVPRALPRAWVDGVDDFLVQHSLDLSQVHVESNPYAVRLVATEADRSAYEALQLQNGGYVTMGPLTRALLIALEELGSAPVSWRTLAMRVRELVMNQHSEQRPDVEGPADRLLFAATIAPRADAVVFFMDGDQPSLRAGRLLGGRVGAMYDILPPGETDLSSGPIAEATIRLAAAAALAHADNEEGWRRGLFLCDLGRDPLLAEIVHTVARAPIPIQLQLADTIFDANKRLLIVPSRRSHRNPESLRPDRRQRVQHRGGRANQWRRCARHQPRAPRVWCTGGRREPVARGRRAHG